MRSIPVFGRKQFERCLKILGFNIYDDRGKGGHGLAKHPIKKPNPTRQIANITIPHIKSKNYDDPRLRKNLVKEVMAFEFTEEQIILALKGRKI